MSSSSPKEMPISEPLPCPECGEERVVRVVETCRLVNGLRIRKLAHYKCQSCGAPLFDDVAVHRIEAARGSEDVSA
jgi:predicted RNA-binding Zn-ribbon protein involved in translation (DUF1610 family)